MKLVTQGQLVRLTATFRTLAGALVDPTTVSVEISREADGVATLDVYNHLGSDLFRTSTGIYYIDVDTSPIGGVWRWRFEATGTGQNAQQGTFYATPASVDASDSSDDESPSEITSLRADLAASDGSTLVGFIQAGTGATVRNAQDKMREQFSVFDFMTSAQVADVQAGTALLDVTAAIQAAIDAVILIGGGRIFFPPGFYLVISTLVVDDDYVQLCGCGTASRLVKTTSGDILQIGDNVTSISDCVVDNLGFSGGDSVGWAVNCRKAPNTRISNCSIANSSTGSGGVILSECWDSRILNNTFGSIKGTGLKIVTSSNGVAVKGNRIDGSSIAAGVGMYITSTGIDVDASNVMETLLTGFTGSPGAGRIGAYFENCVTAIDITLSTPNFSIENVYVAAAASSARAIYLEVANGFSIKNCTFSGTFSDGAPIKLAQAVRDGEIGFNTYSDAAEVTWPADIGILNVRLLSEEKYFSPRNLLENSFAVWPGGVTDSPPGCWGLVGVSHARQTDAPIGRYSCDLIGSSIGLSMKVLPISATKDAELRGRYAAFSFWVKSISGTLSSQLNLNINDGITSTTVPKTLTTSWALYRHVVKIGPTADRIFISIGCANSGTIRVAGPSLFLGTTVGVLGITLPQRSAPIVTDMTTGSLTGSTNIAVIKSAAIDAAAMGTGGRLRVLIAGTISGTAGTKIITVRPNGTSGGVMATVSLSAGETDEWSIELDICNVNGGSQRLRVVAYQGAALEQHDYNTASIDTTADWTLDVCGILGNSGDTISVTMFIVEPKNGM